MVKRYQNYKYEITNDMVKILSYSGEEERIIIPSEIEGYPVGIIGESAFSMGGFQVTEVEVPETVKRIENSAFELCLNLKTCVLHEGLEYMGDDMLCMTAVKELSVPATVKRIDPTVFSDMERLEISPENPYYAVIDGAVYQFRKDAEKEDKILLFLLDLGGRQEFLVDSGTTNIAADAFADRTELRTVFFPKSVREIEPGALEKHNRELDAPGIEKVIFEKGNPCFFANEMGVFEQIEEDGLKLIQYLGQEENPKFTSVIEGTEKKFKAIGEHGFFRSAVKKLVLPESVKYIEKRAFVECKNLKEIRIEADHTILYIPERPQDFRDNLLKNIDSLREADAFNPLMQENKEKEIFHTVVNYKKYDGLFTQEKRLEEKVWISCCRLQKPGGLTAEYRKTYERYLRHNLREIMNDVADREDQELLSALTELEKPELFNAENIDEFVDIFNRKGKTGMLGFLMDYKRKQIGQVEFQFEF